MKYALIAMVAVYLVTFGCNPKTEEEQTTSHDTVEHSTKAEAPAAPAELTVTTHVEKPSTPEAGPANHYNVGSENKPAAPAEVVVTTEKSEKEVQPAAKVEKATEKIAEKAAPAVEDKNAQWKNIAHNAATTVLALMNEEQAPAAEKVAEVKPEQPATETVTILPCGKKATGKDGAQHAPCVKHSKKIAKQPAVPAAPAEETELSEAMQKMVTATNAMVTVTKHLVIATQQMLAASKDVAVEVIDTGKEAIETSKPAVQDAVSEEKIIETVKEVVAATKEAYEATSQALSEAIEAKEAQPEPVATPQQ